MSLEVLTLLAVFAFLPRLTPVAHSDPGVPSSIKYLYVIQLSHLDIGFTDPQDVVAEGCKETIDDAIWLCDHYPNYKWTIEEIWQLQQWWIRSTAQERQSLLNYIRQGRIAVCAGYATEHSSTLGAEEINRFLYPAEILRADLGIPISTIIQDDVPGYAWGLPSVLAKSRTPYMITGTNLWIGGGTSIPPGEFPFYWVGPDGDSVLTWVSTHAYLEGVFYYGLWSVPSAYDSLSLRLPEWEATGYPYDAILVMGGTGDNAGTSISMTRVADDWNATYDNPKIIIATPEQFFAHLEQQYGKEHPAYSGDWGGYWDAGTICTPLSLALCRESHEQAASAEKVSTLASLLGVSTYPAPTFRNAYMNMLEYDEHSGGGGSWPGMMTPEEVRRQNEIAFGYAQTAHDNAAATLGTNLESLLSQVHTGTPALIVFNPLSWTRTEPVRLALSDSLFASNFDLFDGVTSQPVAYQKIIETKEILFLGQSIPPLGYKVFEIRPTSPVARGPIRSARSTVRETRPSPAAGMPATNVLENSFYRVVVDTLDGHIASLFDKGSNRELVDSGSEYQFNGLIKALNRQTWAGKYDHVSSGATQILPGLSGPVAQSLLTRHENSPLVQTEITLYEGLSRIDLVNTLDVRKMEYIPYADGFDYYDFTYPFDLGDFRARMEIANTFMTPEANNLPDAAIPYFVTQHGLDLSETAYGLTWASREGMVHEFDKINAYATTFNPRAATLLSRVIKHGNETEFLGGRIGPFWAEPPSIPLTFGYSLTTHATPFEPVAASHFLWGFANPLLGKEAAVQPTGPLPGPAQSLFTVDPPNVMIVNLKAADWGADQIVRLLEVSGQPTQARLSSPYFRIDQATKTNNVEEDLTPLPVEQNSVLCSFRSSETVTVRVKVSLPSHSASR